MSGCFRTPDEQVFPLPTPTPRWRARGVCRNHGGGCFWPESLGFRSLPGTVLEELGDALGEAPDAQGPPCRSHPSPAFPAGSSFSCRVGGPHHPNLPPGSRKALPARVTRFGIGIQDLPSDLLSWGLGMGACSCRSGLSYPLSTFGEQPRRPSRGRDRDEPGRKLDSADRASRLANSSLLSFCLSFPC